MADDLGEELISMVRGFNCLGSRTSGPDYTADEVARTLYGAKRDVDTQIANACAGFAVEEVCRSYMNVITEGGY